ncbi:MAG: hypothetical protein ACI4U4_03115 [Bacilli bacterium]
MKYVIMAGGPARRWNNYNNTTKHLIKIGSETMLERIVRQLKENNITENIYITSNNPLYEVKGTIRNELIYDNKVYNMFYYKFLDDEITFLYGDTYYSDKVIKDIVESKTNSIVFFGTEKSIVGIKVKDYKNFKKCTEDIKGEEGQVGWAIYRRINNLETNDIKFPNFKLVNDVVKNINKPSDYKELMELKNEADDKK